MENRTRVMAALLLGALIAGAAAAQETGIIGRSQKQEDTAHVSGHYLDIMGAVRDDGGGPLCGTDNDYCPLSVDALGNLYVTVGAGVAGAGAAVVEDAAHVGGEDGSGMMCRRIDVIASSAGATGDWATCNQDATGRIYVVAPDGDALLTTIDADTGAIAIDMAALEVLVTAGNVDLAALEVDLAALEVLVTAGNVDLAALEVLSTAANVDLAALEVLATTIDADTGNIATDTDSLAVTGAGVVLTAQRVTLGSDDPAVVDLAALEVLSTAANVDLAALEVLATTIDADTGAIATDMAALEVLSTAANVDLAALEVLATTIDADTGTIAGAVAGAEMQVDVVAALPAGTNNIGDVDVEIVGTASTVDAELEAQGADFDIELAAANLRLRCIVWSLGGDATAIWTIRHGVLAAAECNGSAVLYLQGTAAATVGQFCYEAQGLAVASGLCADEVAGAAALSVTAMLATEAAP